MKDIEDVEEEYPGRCLPMGLRLLAFGSAFFSLLVFFLFGSYGTFSAAAFGGTLPIGCIRGFFSGLWILTGSLTALLGTAFLLVFIRLIRPPAPLPSGWPRRHFLAFAASWPCLWLLLYLSLRELLILRVHFLRLDILLVFMVGVIILLVGISAYTVNTYRKEEQAFLSGASAVRYSAFALAVFISTGFLLPHAFPLIPSSTIGEICLSDLLASASRSPAFWWAELRTGHLSPNALALSFNSQGLITYMTLDYASPKGRGVSFIYRPDEARDFSSTRMPLVIFPAFSWMTHTRTRFTLPSFSEEDLEATFSRIDERKIEAMLNESLEMYKEQTGEPDKWTSSLLIVGTVTAFSPEASPYESSSLNISVTVSRALVIHDTEGHISLYTAYFSPDDLSITGLEEHERIPNSWVVS
jgi:hypothetical protein